MITESYGAFSIEEGDQIIANGDIYKVVLISDTPLGFRFTIVNEEQDMKHIDCDMSATFKVLCD